MANNHKKRHNNPTYAQTSAKHCAPFSPAKKHRRHLPGITIPHALHRGRARYQTENPARFLPSISYGRQFWHKISENQDIPEFEDFEGTTSQFTMTTINSMMAKKTFQNPDMRLDDDWVANQTNRDAENNQNLCPPLSGIALLGNTGGLDN